MNAGQYYAAHGQSVCAKVAKRAGTNWPYFKQMVYRVRKPGSGLAMKLVVASRKVTPRKPLGLEALLFSPLRRKQKPRTTTKRRNSTK